MKKPEELEAPKVCPFRTEEHYEYANIDDNAVVVDTHRELFPECYGSQCPLHRYDAIDGFYCLQAQALERPYEAEDE